MQLTDLPGLQLQGASLPVPAVLQHQPLSTPAKILMGTIPEAGWGFLESSKESRILPGS